MAAFFKPVALSCICLLVASAAHARVDVGDKPELSLQMIGGVTVTSEDLRGRIVILEFWATWCGPCVKQIPHLKELNEKYASKGVVLISISQDKTAEAAESFAKKKGMNWPQAHDMSRRMTGEFGVSGIPHAFIISPAGEVLWRGHPARIDDPLVKALREHPPQPKKKKKEDDGTDVAKAAIADARQAIVGDTPDWAKMLELIKPITDEQMKNTGVQSQLKMLLKQAARQSRRVPMSDALAADAEGAARLQAMSDAVKVPLDGDTDRRASAGGQAKIHPRIARSKLGKADKAADQGQHLEAYALYAWLARRTPDSEPGQAAAQAIARYEADEVLMRQIRRERAERDAGAMLKTAQEYESLDRKELAKKTYAKILDEFPDTKAAATANAALEKLSR